MSPTSQISWWSFRMGHGRASVGISVHVLVSLNFPFPLLLPLSLSLSFALSLSLKVSPTSLSLLEISIFQMFNRFVKIISPGGIHPIRVGGGQYTSREQHPKLSLASPWCASPWCASPGRAQRHNFSLAPPQPPVLWPLPSAIPFPGRLPWPVGPSATTEVAPAGIQAWNYERMGLSLPPVVHRPQMWNCRFSLPARTGLSHAGRKRLYLSPVRICQNWVTWGRTA